MAPEQLQGKPADARADLFAFGCVLYELLTGRRAFEGASAASVIAAILEREPAPLTLHPPLGRVIARCLAKDPASRFQTARDLKYNLDLAVAREEFAPAAVIQPKRWPWAAAALAATALAATAGWRWLFPVPGTGIAHAVRLSLTPPVGAEFITGHHALSPDGRNLAFCARTAGRIDLYIRPLDSDIARKLDGTEDARYPIWSPDGRFVAYLSQAKLWRIDARGGESPVQIASVHPMATADWARDGALIWGTAQHGLRRLDAGAGEPRLVTRLNPERGEDDHVHPQVVGDRVIYFVRSGKPGVRGVYIAALSHPERSQLLVPSARHGVYSNGHLIYDRNGSLVAQRLDLGNMRLSGDAIPLADNLAPGNTLGRSSVAAANAGDVLAYSARETSQLVWFARTGERLGVLGEPASYRGAAVLSPDGRQAAVTRETGIWLLDTQRGAATRLASDGEGAAWPLWSPDSRWLAFRGGRDFGLYRREVLGNTELKLEADGDPRNPTSWSTDGRLIAFARNSVDGRSDIWVHEFAAAGTSGRSYSYLRTPFSESHAAFRPGSPARWVAYTSDESGREEVYVQAFPEPGSKVAISTAGGTFSQWSPDGREIFYLDGDRRLMAVAIQEANGRITASAPRALFAITVDQTTFAAPFSVMPDGRFLVRLPLRDGPQPIKVILNWTALLAGR